MDDHVSEWGYLSPELAEKALSKVAQTDLAAVRLVSRRWYEASNIHVTRWRPKTLHNVDDVVPDVYPNLRGIDLTLLDDDDGAVVELETFAKAAAKLEHLREVVVKTSMKADLTPLAAHLPRLRHLGVRPCGGGSPADHHHHACMGGSVASSMGHLHLEIFENLNSLDLSWNTIDVGSVMRIAGSNGLEVLNLKNCFGADDAIVEILASMSSLKILNLSNTGVTDDGLMTTNDLPLEQLNLSKCEGITDDGMYWLQHVRSLRQVDISGCPWISSAGVELLGNLPRLDALYLQDTKLDGKTSFFKKMEKLEKLSLRDCAWVGDSTLAVLGRHCKKIRSLNLRNCTNVTDEGLRHLCDLPELECLNLRGCTQLTDAGVGILCQLPHLQDLDLSFLNRISDVGLVRLKDVTGLRRLIINWCNQITSKGIRQLRGCSDGGNDGSVLLKELSIKGCHNVRSDDLNWISSSWNVAKLDYEHSLCTAVNDHHRRPSGPSLPLLRHIDSVGCFVEIC